MNPTGEQITRFRNLLKCPVDWRSVIRRSVDAGNQEPIVFADTAIAFLEAYWCKLVDIRLPNGMGQGCEYFNCYSSNFSNIDPDSVMWSEAVLNDPLSWELFAMDSPHLEGKIFEVEQWIGDVQTEYRNRVRNLVTMQIEDPRGKHFLPGQSDEVI